MNEFKHYNIFTREVVFEDEEADFGKAMKEQSKSLMVIGGDRRKSNFPEKHHASIRYEYRQSLPNPR
tara:strand:+ start:859 stop:1059 length:201 start_codon:yes stop_codon:yes gene_type:complete